MAIASVSAGRIDWSPMGPSSSRSESDVAPDSPDRTDHSDSSPKPNRDIDIKSPASLRSEEYRQLFRLPPEEVLVQDFNCAFQESILLQGHMYLFVHYICFYSNIFGFETKKIIPFHDVSSVKRAKTAGFFPNAIEIFAGGRKYFFASFLSRDEAFKLINDGWLQNGNDAKAVTEQQESVSGSNCQENGLPTEKVSSVKQVNELDSSARCKDIPSNDPELSPPVENDCVSLTHREIQENVDQGVEPVGNTSASSSTKSQTWNTKTVGNSISPSTKTHIWIVENIDAPEIPPSYTRVTEAKFPIKVEEFFNFFFADVDFGESFHTRSGDKEFRCSSWYPHEKLGHARDVSFQHPIKIYFGAKYGSCQEVQKFRVYRNSHLVIETSQEVSDVPYGDYFRVEGLWDVVRDGDESDEGCILQIYVNVAFIKKTVFKGKIVQSTLEECREAYATWITLAHDLLKQKSLEKQEEEDPAARMIRNIDVHSEMEVKTEEAFDRSCKSRDDTRISQMPGSMEVNQCVGNVMQGNFMNATSIVSLLGEYMMKLYSFLRSQNQITVIVVIAFVVIFLMQVSIVALLNRPQKIQIISQGDYYAGGLGRGIGEGSSEAVAWLERRMHHLKDEMFVVEAQLERLRREHTWLKTQLKDLNNYQKHK